MGRSSAETGCQGLHASVVEGIRRGHNGIPKSDHSVIDEAGQEYEKCWEILVAMKDGFAAGRLGVPAPQVPKDLAEGRSGDLRRAWATSGWDRVAPCCSVPGGTLRKGSVLVTSNLEFSRWGECSGIH